MLSEAKRLLIVCFSKSQPPMCNRQSTIDNRQLLLLLFSPNIKPGRPQSQHSQGGRSSRGSGRRRTLHLGLASVCKWAGIAGSNRFIGLGLVKRSRSTWQFER